MITLQKIAEMFETRTAAGKDMVKTLEDIRSSLGPKVNGFVMGRIKTAIFLAKKVKEYADADESARRHMINVDANCVGDVLSDDTPDTHEKVIMFISDAMRRYSKEPGASPRKALEEAAMYVPSHKVREQIRVAIHEVIYLKEKTHGALLYDVRLMLMEAYENLIHGIDDTPQDIRLLALHNALKQIGK